jgi:NhaP-type Na+/H+ or K+/H+ antiporter
MDDSFQPTIDMLLNVSVFIWFGAICPWTEFYHNDVIPIWRLVILGILVLLLRRPPIVFALHKQIPQIEQKRQALFVGFFGPIGVSAIFYLYVSLEFLGKIRVDGEIREDAKYLMEVMNVVIWFLCICSVVRKPPSFLQRSPLILPPGNPRPQHPNGKTRLLHPAYPLPGYLLGLQRPRTLPRSF